MAEQDVLAKLNQKGGRGIWGSGKNTLELEKGQEISRLKTEIVIIRSWSWSFLGKFHQIMKH